jgi:hypothetical protein
MTVTFFNVFVRFLASLEMTTSFFVGWWELRRRRSRLRSSSFSQPANCHSDRREEPSSFTAHGAAVIPTAGRNLSVIFIPFAG